VVKLLRILFLTVLVAFAAPVTAADAPSVEAASPPPAADVEALFLRQRTFHLSGYVSHW
jgi:hypothetical protein